MQIVSVVVKVQIKSAAAIFLRNTSDTLSIRMALYLTDANSIIKFPNTPERKNLDRNISYAFVQQSTNSFSLE